MLKEIVNNFSEICDYEILKETEEDYVIKDLQFENEVFECSKKVWYEKILVYWLEERLLEEDYTSELTLSQCVDICRYVVSLDDAIEDYDNKIIMNSKVGK